MGARLSMDVFTSDRKSFWANLNAEACRVERLIAGTIAQTFFSSNPALGRAILLALAIVAPRLTALGCLGLLLGDVSGKFISRNEKIRSSGLFALNGWYFGMSAASFIASGKMAGLVIAGFSPACAVFVVALDRFLRTWDLPVLVLPYVLSSWCVQLLSRLNPELAFHVAPSLPDIAGLSAYASLGIGALRGFGQIFFQDNLLFSAAVVGILIWFNRGQALALIIAALVPTMTGYLTLGHHWAWESGLCSFGGILIWAARREQALSVTPSQYGALILFSGIAELIALQWAAGAGVFSLSLSYVVLIWMGKLVCETEKAQKSLGPVSMPW